MRILITAGGTEEPVDGVRRLTNISTGATGLAIARYFHDRGAEVLLLHAERTPAVDTGIECDAFTTFSDLRTALQHHLAHRRFDAVVHLAAVSDYAVASLEIDGRQVPHGNQGKITGGTEVVIRLHPTAKLIDSLRHWSCNPAIRVVGFKLTNDANADAREEKVKTLLARGTTDVVVHNDLTELSSRSHRAEIWSPQGPLARTGTKEELAEVLFDLLRDDHHPPCSEIPR